MLCTREPPKDSKHIPAETPGQKGLTAERILYPEKSFRFGGEVNNFPDKQIMEFITTRPASREILKRFKLKQKGANQ